MEDDKVLHNILLKKAKEAEYSSFEIEQINLQTETLFIRYFLEREAAKVVEGTKIEDEILKKIEIFFYKYFEISKSNSKNRINFYKLI